MRTLLITTIRALLATLMLTILLLPGLGLIDTAPPAAVAFGLFGLAAMRQAAPRHWLLR